jgi:hypothetical protein
MANPPPPYSDITGISRAVMKDNAQETLANYNGNARPGELVVNLVTDPPALYVGNNAGQLTAITSGSSSYGNANVATFLANFGSNTISTTGNITAGNASFTGDISAENNAIVANTIGAVTRVTGNYMLFDVMPFNNLPAAQEGARAWINDGNLVAAGNFGAQVSDGGGTGGNTVPVWSDGFNWYIG